MIFVKRRSGEILDFRIKEETDISGPSGAVFHNTSYFLSFGHPFFYSF